MYSGGSISSPPTPYSTDLSNSSTGSIFNPSPTMYTFQRSPDSTVFDKPVRPYLELVEQTAPMFRFRYVTEMQGTHGAIRGINSGKNEKTFPTVKLCNYNAPAVIRCTLYTVDKKSLHVHRLVGKCSGEKKDDPHDIQVGPNRHNGFIASFQNLVIIHTAKKQLVHELIEKKKRVIKANYPNSVGFDIAPETLKKMQKEAQEETKKMDPNCACLKFEALILQNGHYVPLPDCKPIYSNGIKNMKNHVTGQLKICRIDRVSGSCEGGDEIFLFVEKVGKDNVKVVMTECDEFGEEVWHDYCTFSPSDVHHQFGIVCKTPKYRSSDIKQKVSVKLQLERKTDYARSEPVEFTYKPKDHHVQFTESCKRKRLASEISSVDLPHVSPSQNLEVTSTTGLETSDLRHKIPFGNLNVFDYDDNGEQDPMWSGDYVAVADDSELFAPFEKSASFTEIVEQLPTPDYDQIKTVCNSDPADMGFTYVDNVTTKTHIVDDTPNLIVFQSGPLIPFNPPEDICVPEADVVGHEMDSVKELRPKPGHSSNIRAYHQMDIGVHQMDSVKELRPKPGHSSNIRAYHQMDTGVHQMDSVKEIGSKPGQNLNHMRPIQHEMMDIGRTTADNKRDIHYADHEVEPRIQGCEFAYIGNLSWRPYESSVDPSDALEIDGVEVPTKPQLNPTSKLRKNHDLIEYLGKSAIQKEALLKWKNLTEHFKFNVFQAGLPEKRRLPEKRIQAELFVSRVNQSLRRYRDAECFPCINVDKDILPKVKQLLSVRTVHGNSCVHTAVLHKQIDELRSLIRYLQLYKSTEYINDTNSSQQTALHLAVSDETKINIEMIKMLIEAGGDANKPDKYGRSTLHIAVRLNYRSIVKCLLETQQIDIDYVSESDGTALHIATANNRVDIIKLLLEYGADVNSINHKDGRTPLHIAVSHKNEDIASLLVQQRNLKPEKKDFKGYTPFELAVVNDSEWWRKIIKLLGKCSNEEDSTKANKVGEVGEVCKDFIKLMIKENDKENGEADS